MTRSGHCACEIEAAGEPDLGIGESKTWALSERAGYRASESHLKSVENPGDPERKDDEGVEPPP